MLKIENCIRIEWKYYPDRNRFKLYIFKCKICNKEVKAKKSGFSDHTGKCQKCSAKETIRIAIKKNKLRPFEARYNNFRRRVKEEKTISDVSFEDYLGFTKISNCTYCEDLIPWEEYSINMSGFFLDRKDNCVDHIKSNLVVCCKICNFTKRDEFSFEEFKLIGKAIKIIKQKRFEEKHKVDNQTVDDCPSGICEI